MIRFGRGLWMATEGGIWGPGIRGKRQQAGQGRFFSVPVAAACAPACGIPDFDTDRDPELMRPFCFPAPLFDTAFVLLFV